jgi:diguanylate cyclase
VELDAHRRRSGRGRLINRGANRAVTVDRDLIAEILVSYRARSAIRILVEFANENGSMLIVEGVETLDQLNMLRALGVKYIQGFLLGEPG